jgi:hypothetical protein
VKYTLKLEKICVYGAINLEILSLYLHLRQPHNLVIDEDV